MTTLYCYLEGVGLIAPGLSDWPQAAAVLRGDTPYIHRPTELPLPEALPSAERRRSGPPVKLALGAGAQAVTASGRDPVTLPAVLSASSGDGFVFCAICEALASDDPLISPTRFHNSVHNAAAGYWGIATGAMTPSNAICAHDGSFGAGLLDAACQVVANDEACVLIAYDTPYPQPLHAARPVREAFGVALVLAPMATDRSVARLAISLTEAPGHALANAGLEALRTAIPAARSLPLLAALARFGVGASIGSEVGAGAGASGAAGGAGKGDRSLRADEIGEAATVVLDYLDDLRVEVAVAPCR
jgi:hypothetical protein